MSRLEKVVENQETITELQKRVAKLESRLVTYDKLFEAMFKIFNNGK